ncbi:double-stranded RNA-binding protein 1-like [Humulus lupulus]|uniref:double-stranded RNA-binding protein 1-like n=1 Tax=Humulus lupulus TaxID=3486 RepID=UPI002B40C121|nr:double-stranded RNA-binding protein 1-like [Humulus lupulus]XP_062119669.1 double-stranded RNA-binding protein 1-like [Humulus lupulus]
MLRVPNPVPGVSNCYVFKSRLQEYAQKVGVGTPVYETTKEGPSHEPFFKSTVIVNDVRYDSLPGFSNRKAAEQSAAEVALRELAKSGGSGDVNQCISQPVHETGLCKNLLQEYTQKMNYAIPLYQCQKDEAPGRAALFSCSIEIGGIRYIGASARTKKEAEIKAARTALLAIQSSASESYNKQIENAQLTVLPCKKRSIESNAKVEEPLSSPKPKKARFRKKTFKKKFSGNRANQTEVNNAGKCNVGTDDALVVASEQLGTETVLVNPQDEMHQMPQSETEKVSAGEGGSLTNVVENGQSTVSDSNQSNSGTLPPISSEGALTNSTDVAKVETSSADTNVIQSEQNFQADDKPM